jgi:hypothetical protein
MTTTKSISWKDLTGNKFSVALHPAMDSEDGYHRQQLIRRVGEASKTAFVIRYDRAYLLRYLATKICRPLFSCGKERAVQLIAKAWDLHYQPDDHSGAITYLDN